MSSKYLAPKWRCTSDSMHLGLANLVIASLRGKLGEDSRYIGGCQCRAEFWCVTVNLVAARF